MADVTYSAEFTLKVDELKKAVVDAQKGMEKLKQELAANKLSTEDFEKASAKLASTLKTNMSALSRMTSGTRELENAQKSLAGKFRDLLPDSIKKFLAIGKEIKNVIDLKAQSGEAIKLGAALKTGLRAGIKAAVQFGATLNAATGGLLLIIAAIVAVVAVLGAAIKHNAAEQEKFNKAVNTQKDAWDAMKNSVGAVNNEARKNADNVSKGERAAAATHVLWKKIGDFFSRNLVPIVEKIKSAFGVVANLAGVIARAVGWVTDEEIEAGIAAERFAENYNTITEAATEYANTIAAISLDTAKGDQDRLNAMNSYIDALAKQSVLMGGVDAEVEKTLAEMIEQRDALAAALSNEKDAQEEYNEEMEKLAELERVGLKNTKDLMAARKAAATTFIADLEKEYALAANIYGAYSRQAQAIADKIRLTQRVIEANTEAAEAETRSGAEAESLLQQEIDARKAIEKQMADGIAQAERNLRVDKDHAELLTDRAQRTKALEEANTKYQESLANVGDEAERNLRAIQDQFNIIENESPNFVAALTQAQELYKGNVIQLETISELEKLNADIEEARETRAKTIAALEVKRQAGLISEEDYIQANTAAIETQNNAVAALAGEYEKVPGAIEKIKAALEKIPEAAKKINLKEKAGEIAGYVGQVGGAITEIASSFAEIQKNQFQELIDNINTALETELEDLDELRQKALEAAGFAKATTEEELARSMEAAIASGDEAVIYAEKRRQEELKINQEYDAKEKAAKEKAAKEIAELEYQQAMFDWQNQLLQAAVSIAQAILTGYAQMGPLGGLVGAGIMLGVGTAQIAAIMSAQPRKKFARGAAFDNGVITEPTNFNIGQMGEAGPEAIMPLREMSDGSLGVTASGGASQTTVQLYLDGVAAGIVSVINDGQTQRISSRMVAS
jgi:hypothetical protein